MHIPRVFKPSLRRAGVNEGDLERWLVYAIAATLRIPPEDIDVRRSFADYGLDSLQLVSLSGELETHLHRRLSETVAWDYPTIELLARHLNHPEAGYAAPVPVNLDAEVEYES